MNIEIFFNTVNIAIDLFNLLSDNLSKSLYDVSVIDELKLHSKHITKGYKLKLLKSNIRSFLDLELDITDVFDSENVKIYNDIFLILIQTLSNLELIIDEFL